MFFLQPVQQAAWFKQTMTFLLAATSETVITILQNCLQELEKLSLRSSGTVDQELAALVHSLHTCISYLQEVVLQIVCV